MEGATQQPGEGQGPTPEEIQARVEEQLAKVRVHDLLLESVVGILNLAARRIAKEDERDLDQARLGIDAVRAVVDLLEPEPARAVRDALAELQMLYAREAGGKESAGGPPAEDSGADAASAPPEPPPARGAGGDLPPRLWTPPGSSGSSG
ncbi:MAG: hypothetical protein QOJ01_1612 [Solirubrobacterales bacterium]|jgi:hypothetical protein|nr:hypothetical protein [Solirubrobacterales bacterium]